MASVESVALYPLLFEPVLKDYIWGGRNLATRLGRPLPPDINIAESWEIAAHENGDVTVMNGSLTGRTLSELTRKLGPVLVGDRAQWALERQKFPLLIKLLDATHNLSVQVHPGDDYALQHEGNELGKTEMWIVLDADDDASIILGVKAHTTPQAFRCAIGVGHLEQHLHEIPVSVGDFVCVPSGSLHAIKGGVLIAEIQQNSDVTYRVYDWKRVGHDGKLRPLHVDQALDVINFGQVEPSLPRPRALSGDEGRGVRRWELCRNDYFVVERVELDAGASYEGHCNGGTLRIWGALQGKAMLEGGAGRVGLEAVRFTLLPARLGSYAIIAGEDEAAGLIHAYLP